MLTHSNFGTFKLFPVVNVSFSVINCYYSYYYFFPHLCCRWRKQQASRCLPALLAQLKAAALCCGQKAKEVACSVSQRSKSSLSSARYIFCFYYSCPRISLHSSNSPSLYQSCFIPYCDPPKVKSWLHCSPVCLWNSCCTNCWVYMVAYVGFLLHLKPSFLFVFQSQQ